jgi:hypothetical protein
LGQTSDLPSKIATVLLTDNYFHALLCLVKASCFPRVAQRDGTQKSIGLRASFVAFRNFEGRDISDLLRETDESIEWTIGDSSSQWVSRCATRGKSDF